jgi:hypothetical protein
MEVSVSFVSYIVCQLQLIDPDTPNFVNNGQHIINKPKHTSHSQEAAPKPCIPPLPASNGHYGGPNSHKNESTHNIYVVK